ncbi:MAG: hypothetical protein R3Y36_05875 [Spirochaetales bacterium]
MEELRSTAIIDSEILEDSRKKAERILANSLNECKNILAEVPEQLEKIRQEKKISYEEKIASHKYDMDAAIPLEKQRYIVEFEESSVQKAITDYLTDLPEEKKLSLIQKLLKRYTDYLKGKKLIISVLGFKPKDIAKIVSSELGKDAILQCETIDSAQLSRFQTDFCASEGMIIETEDTLCRCRVIIGELVSEIIDSHSYELTSALFCGRLPE